MREVCVSEKRHERGGFGLAAFGERFQGMFVTDGGTKPHDDSVNNGIGVEPMPDEAHII